MISELIVNILRVLVIRKMMELFFPVDDEDGKKVWSGFACYYLLSAILYGIFNISVPYGICNYLGIAGLTFLYQGTWKNRIWVSLVVFITDMACALAVFFAFSQKFIIHQQAIQTLLLLILVTIISHIAYPADSREIAFDKRQTFILIVIPLASVFILCVLLYGGYEGATAMLICISILIINLSIFYLYHMMAENYRNLRENDIYRQQTYAYANQLDVIMESQGRLRALRHDMKNHILALQMLLQKREWEEAGRYLSSMQNFMVNPSEYISTGNESVDSLLNYKLQRANEILDTVEAKISIPEKLMLHSFDLNVVLGNLLDNAIEAAGKTEEKKLKIAINLEKGILFIHIRNSCLGIADGKVGRLETTKEDAPNHGIGLGNVQRIIEKYHGDMELICENGSMETDIIMYIKEM
ncbi:sensor histidine kinase [Parablautia muri]|uniref:sensor histidine kinase n=1 Tax=Parablautia muri TaxID=2320879 RepID=UPI0013699E34